MAAMGSVKHELDEAAAIIRMQTARIAELEAENERLKAALDADAHGTLRAIYTDPDAPRVDRIRAASASLAHEKPKLMPERAPLDLAAQPVEDLATVVARGRARLDRILALPLEERSEMASPGYKGGNDDDHS